MQKKLEKKWKWSLPLDMMRWWCVGMAFLDIFLITPEYHVNTRCTSPQPVQVSSSYNKYMITTHNIIVYTSNGI